MNCVNFDEAAKTSIYVIQAKGMIHNMLKILGAGSSPA